MRSPLLSICIATHNRADFISETLDSITPQLTDEVEIVIVDGASTDRTPEIIRSYSDKHKQINYIQLAKKGGVDLDYCIAVEKSKGDMCWLFTDDDIIKPGAVKTVLNEVKKNYSLIVVNAEVMNKDLSQVIQKNRLKMDCDEIFPENKIESLFLRAVSYMSFIGCVVINRELWLKRDKQGYFGTEFIHVGVIFQSPVPGVSLIISTPLLSIRYGNAQWSNKAFEIWIIRWRKLLKSFNSISEKSIMKILHLTPMQLLKTFIGFRATGSYGYNDYKKWLTSSEAIPWFKIPALLISLIPVKMLSRAMLFYMIKIKKSKDMFSITDLMKSRYYPPPTI
jgi:abequosyltransferase